MDEKLLKGEFKGITAEDEDRMLDHVQKIAAKKLENARGSVKALQQELHELKEVYDADDKEGLAQWFNTDARFEEVKRDLLRAERAGKKPFFGRIDIIDEEALKKETFYIGKTLIADNPAIPEVIDWRTPVASVYYDHSLGKCKYKVPGEAIYSVDLKRKRTYEIEDNKIKDFYDSDVVANDDLLTKYLSKSKRNVLSEIIATIQEEQNEVIRKNPHHNVLVQGSAGSGKTTVAMHRISYILYNYETEFKPDGFYIVGSNKVLLNYITGVLPDLDVYGVKQMTMEELFVRLLYEDWEKKIHSVRRFDKKEKSIGIKGTGEWVESLKEYLGNLERSLVPSENVTIKENGRVILTKEDIDKELKKYPEKAMAWKMARLNDVLISRLETELFNHQYTYNSEIQKKLTMRFNGYFNRFIYQGSVFDIYSDFIAKKKMESRDVVYVENNPDLYDLASLAYIYKRIKETEVIQEAGHVVIDEAQDFGMAVYHSLKYCMSKCTFTIMGDVSQNINLGAGLSDWEELKKVMLPDRLDFFGLLKKSYRNTVEISEFATDILRHGTFPIYPVEPIIRHGDKVVPVKCGDILSLNNSVVKKIRNYKEKGYETVAVICKDREESEFVYNSIKDKAEVKLFTDADTEFSKDTVVLPIEYSKGLEFDAVIIYDASEEAYPKEDGYAKLLYVAATRALHELTVFYMGDLTGLIKDPIPEDRKNITFEKDDYHITPFKYEEEFKTREEKARESAAEGDRERALRDKYGPKKIVVNAPKPEPVKKVPPITHTEKKTIAPGVYIRKTEIIKPEIAYKKPVELEEKPGETEYGTMPETSRLMPVGHGKIDNSVRWIKTDKKKVEITGAYGTLRITPVSDETVRIIFYKEESGNIRAIPGEIKETPGLKWRCIDGREAVEIQLPKLIVRVEKKTGAICFVSVSNKSIYLAENPILPRQFHGTKDIWWEYFDFGKKESLSVRGEVDVDWKEFANSARYISHGHKDRCALLFSSKGYEILVPGGIKVLACTIPAYGPYISFEDSPVIDYFFRAAR